MEGLKRRRAAAIPKLEKAPAPQVARPATPIAKKQTLEPVGASKQKKVELATVEPRHTPPSVSSSRLGGDWMSGSGALTAQYEAARARLLSDAPKNQPLVGPPAGATVAKPGTSSLIGLRDDFFDAKASYAENLAKLKAQGIPRFPLLTADERTHETAFADAVQKDPAFFVEGADVLAANEKPGTAIFEVDAMKRLYDAYGVEAKPATPEARTFRLAMNHALHPTAVAIARLSFLKQLDTLAKLPADDPNRKVFVISGGVAAGKGSLNEIFKRVEGDVKFGATWDAAGEGDARENAWLLDAITSRGLDAIFGFATANPLTRYPDVLSRQAKTGRMVDVMTFTNSYVDGTKHMKSFLDSPEYAAAAQSGAVSAFLVDVGRWDDDTRTYPDAKELAAGPNVKSSLLGDPPAKAAIFERALGDLEQWATNERAQGRDPTDVLTGGLAVDEKFAQSGAMETP